MDHTEIKIRLLATNQLYMFNQNMIQKSRYRKLLELTSILLLQRNEIPNTQVDPFYRHGENEILRSDETVTIFGFPRNNIMMIIDDFSVFGKIKNYQLDPNGGNWAHVQFENKFQVFPSIF